jgi:hypothetical protein
MMIERDFFITITQSSRAASMYTEGIWKAFTKVVRDEGFSGRLSGGGNFDQDSTLRLSSSALYRGTVPVLCIVGPRVSLQYMGLAMYKPMFERLEGKFLPAHSSAGLAGVSVLFNYNSLVNDGLIHVDPLTGLHWYHTGCNSR